MGTEDKATSRNWAQNIGCKRALHLQPNFLRPFTLVTQKGGRFFAHIFSI